MDTGRSIRGEDVRQLDLAILAGPALLNFTVQPRSLSLFRAEEMLSMTGAIRLEGDAGGRELINGSELELRDAVLIDADRAETSATSAFSARSPPGRRSSSAARRAEAPRAGGRRPRAGSDRS